MNEDEAPRRPTARAFRRAGAWAATVGLVLVLAGCGPAGGQTRESAESSLLSIPGVSDASVTTRSVTSGFAQETSTSVEIGLEPGVTVPDDAALADYLLKVAWSTTTEEANWALRVEVLSDPQISILDAVAAAGWETRTGIADDPAHASVRADEAKERLGAWPGDVPELPEGIIVGPTPAPSP